jgi:hypothetical protein
MCMKDRRGRASASVPVEWNAASASSGVVRATWRVLCIGANNISI